MRRCRLMAHFIEALRRGQASEAAVDLPRTVVVSSQALPRRARLECRQNAQKVIAHVEQSLG